MIASSPSHGPSIESPPRRMSSRSFAAAPGGFDLEISDLLDLLRHPCEERRGQGRPGDRRILDHDRNVDRIGEPFEERLDERLAHADRRTVIGRHHHDHRRARFLRAPRPFRADTGAGVRGRHDDRYAAGNMIEDGSRQDLPLVVSQHELLGEVRKDREPVAAGVDHEIDASLLALKIELPGVGERRWNDREDTLVPHVLIAHRVSFVARPSLQEASRSDSSDRGLHLGMPRKCGGPDPTTDVSRR